MALLNTLIYTSTFFIVMGIGIIFGKLKQKKLQKKSLSKIQELLLYGLLVFLGIRFGSNPEVINNLATLGVKGLIIGLFVIIFAFLGGFVYSKLFFRKRSDKNVT